MRVVVAALLLALFIFCTSTEVKKPKKKVPPVVTVGYLLYEPKAKSGKNNMWESQFNSSVDEVQKTRKPVDMERIALYIKNFKTWNITKVDQQLSSELDRETK
uniref:Putative salivary secreted peptide n=1 Tax=Ixodes ricinus TaxID=34613 RepID=V5GHL6_IXORI